MAVLTYNPSTQEFKDSLVYIVSSRVAKGYTVRLCLNKQNFLQMETEETVLVHSPSQCRVLSHRTLLLGDVLWGAFLLMGGANGACGGGGTDI